MGVLDTKTLRHRVYDLISDRIIQAQLLPGEKINLRTLSSELGVSISPIRDALLKLESEQAIILEANKRILINQITSDEVEEIFDIRKLLESRIIREACMNRPDNAVHQARMNYHAMEMSLQVPREYLIANSNFHFHIYSFSKSRISIKYVRELWKRIAPYYSLHLTSPEDCESDLLRHKIILEAFGEKDPKMIVQALHDDISGSKEFIKGILSEHGRDGTDG